MDIVVTIPKSEYENDDLETKDMIERNLCQFWTLNKIPKKLNIGDRVWFVKNNKIDSSMRIFEVKYNSQEQCLTTNIIRVGKCILYMDDLKYCTENIITKGFQGFRYKWW